MSEPSHERLMLTDASYKAGYSIAQARVDEAEAQVAVMAAGYDHAEDEARFDTHQRGFEAALQLYRERIHQVRQEVRLSKAAKKLLGYKALAGRVEEAERERYNAIERGVCAVEVAQYYQMRWTTEKQDRVVLRDMWRQAEALAERRKEEAEFKEYNISCGCKAVRGAIVFTEICRKHRAQGAKPGRLMGDDYARAAIEEDGA